MAHDRRPQFGHCHDFFHLPRDLWTDICVQFADFDVGACHAWWSLRVFGCRRRHDVRDSAIRRSVFAVEEEWAFVRCGPIEIQAHAERIKNDLQYPDRAEAQRTPWMPCSGVETRCSTTQVSADLLPYVCDAAPSKQGKFLPGSHISILAPTALDERRPDIVLILSWNIANEVMAQQRGIKRWGGRFAVAVPRLEIRDA